MTDGREIDVTPQTGGTVPFPAATEWIVCSPADHNFSAVLDWMGGISQIAGFLCSKCASFRRYFRETGEIVDDADLWCVDLNCSLQGVRHVAHLAPLS